MEQIKFKARLRAPHFTQAPPEEVEKWAKNIVASADKSYKHSKIMEYFTGKPVRTDRRPGGPLDMSRYKQPSAPDSPIQMDMHLDLQVRWE